MKRWISCLLFFSTLVYGETTFLQVREQTIKINGKEAKMYAVVQQDGTMGLSYNIGDLFDVHLENVLEIPTSIHWHGLILPCAQDGAAFVTQFPIYPKVSYNYQFPIVQSGTFWMHSHFGLEKQKLLEAPLILHDPAEALLADQEAVILLSDFSFKSPEAIFQQLKSGGHKTSKKKEDIVEVNYDAFLANLHTLENPQIIQTVPGKIVRLRMINGASNTNFFLDLNALEGRAIAVDGNRIQPVKGSYFELAVAQRIDILVTIPDQGGAFPILAQGEGTDKQTGIILVTEGTQLPKIASKTLKKAGRFTNIQEAGFQALSPLPKKPIDRKIRLELAGDMATYQWTINGQSWPEVTPLLVEQDQRVEIVFNNVSSMSHPMHLHGHIFQVTAINGQPIEGALRDTVFIPQNSSVSIQFDADNPGVWPLHCHLLYHQEAGMSTVLRYGQFVQKLE